MFWRISGTQLHILAWTSPVKLCGIISHNCLLRWTLLGHLGTKLDRPGHQGGAKCRWSKCNKLKKCEDKWICRLLLCSSISSSCHRIFPYKYANNSNSILFWSENLISPPYWIWPYIYNCKTNQQTNFWLDNFHEICTQVIYSLHFQSLCKIYGQTDEMHINESK